MQSARILIVLTALAITGCTPHPSTVTKAPVPKHELSNIELIDHAVPSIFEVVVGGRVGQVNGLFQVEPSVGGTAFFIDREGYMLTNNHVVSSAAGTWEGEPRIQVQPRVEGFFPYAKLVGTDPMTDIALIKVEPKDFPGGIPDPISIADPKSIRPGQDVVAIGFPLGLSKSPTVTHGIVSGTDRTSFERLDAGQVVGLTGLIQTDAPINHGNSGGPLLNRFGEAVGINTLSYGVDPNGDRVNSVYFAVGARHIQRLVGMFKTFGKAVRADLGMEVAEITQQTQPASDGRSRHIPAGCLVVSVAPGGPAEAAGIQVNDVVVTVNGESVETPGSFDDLRLFLDVGGTAELKFQRFPGPPPSPSAGERSRLQQYIDNIDYGEDKSATIKIAATQ